MTRSVSVKFGGKKVELVASFGAARDIRNNVHDPLLVYNDQQRAAFYWAIGREYKSQFLWDIGKVAEVIQIGIKHAGIEASLDDVEAFMVEVGLDKSQAIAQDYLALFFAEPETKPEEAVAAEDKDAEPGK